MWDLTARVLVDLRLVWCPEPHRCHSVRYPLRGNLPDGARVIGRKGWSWSGDADGDLVAERLKLTDVVAGSAFPVEAAGVVVRSEGRASAVRRWTATARRSPGWTGTATRGRP